MGKTNRVDRSWDDDTYDKPLDKKSFEKNRRMMRKKKAQMREAQFDEYEMRD